MFLFPSGHLWSARMLSLNFEAIGEGEVKETGLELQGNVRRMSHVLFRAIIYMDQTRNLTRLGWRPKINANARALR